MYRILIVYKSLSRRGKLSWLIAIFLGILSSIFEVMTAATFSILTSSIFGGRNSNFGVLTKVLPIPATKFVVISMLGFFFVFKLFFQWMELNFKTKSAGEFFSILYEKKVKNLKLNANYESIPTTNLSGDTHTITHNVFYPSSLIISELIMIAMLLPFLFLISPKGSLLIFSITFLISIPALNLFRKLISKYSWERYSVDKHIDELTYIDFRTYFDQGIVGMNKKSILANMQISSEIDKKIVKLGTYPRLAIELSFLLAILISLSFIDLIVSKDGRIQFFAILAYCFFRIIPAFSRITVGRNQLASNDSVFRDLLKIGNSRREFASNVKPSYFTQQIEIKFLSEVWTTNNFKFEVNNRVLIKGNTGVGKTTLLKVIGGFEKRSFEVFVDGKYSLKSEEWQPKFSFVSQNPFLYGSSIREIVTRETNLEYVNLQRFESSLAIANINESAWEMIQRGNYDSFSGGEKKQLALARALYSEPDILLLDELTAGMDNSLAIKILKNLEKYLEIKLIVMSTHEEDYDAFFNSIFTLIKK